MAFSSWKDIPAAGDAPAFRVFEGDLEKPALDDRQYRLLELHNGLRAVLVHDQAADKAAASLAVTTGYMLDPDDIPGLAHFCEHMMIKATLFVCLIQGSEKYPSESDYHSFISANGGIRNAVTGPPSTEYWFSISPSALAGGLERLADLHCAPLFTESLTAREVNAVDSEFKRNWQNDARRVLQVNKTLGIPGHPWSKFGTGNYVSLTAAGRRLGEDVSEETVLKETRRRLVEWWKSQYCASRMMLAVIGKESLDELTGLVVPVFSKIANRGLDPRPAFKNDAWGPEHMGTVVFVQTVKDYHAFSLSFQLPDLREHYATKPASFLAHFLGHEGPGSICAYLKKRGWLLDISAGVSGTSRSVQFFKISGRLTLEGYLHYRDVIRTIFGYIALLRAAFPLEPYHFNEVKTMAETRFRFKEKAQPHRNASALAHGLAEPYPPEWLLSGAALYREYDEALVKGILEDFVPERGRIVLEAKAHRPEVVGDDVVWETEKWYGTRYAVKRMDESFLQELGKPSENKELHLPAPNPFIPQDLSVGKIDPAKYPVLIKRTEKSQLWYKKDDQFWVPKAHVKIDIKTPLAYATPRLAMLTRLFVDLVEDALAEVTYDADLAGLSYSVVNQIEGLTVSVGGYSDKIHVLLGTVLDKLRGLQVHPDRLRVLKEKIQREYENFYMGQPSGLSESYATWAFMPTIWTPAEKLLELSLITENDVSRHRDELLSRVFVEALVNGNVTRERAIEILGVAEQSLNYRPLVPSETPRQRSLVLPPASNVISRRQHANPKEVNSSLSYYLQFGEVTDVNLRSTLALIAHILREPCYAILRTEEQLGYVVACAQWSINGTIGLGVKIQSTRAPWFTESRVDVFFERMGDRIAAMPADDLATQKEGLIVKTLERPKNLGEESARFWGHIRSGYYDFVKHEADADAIRALTLAEVIRTYDALVRPSTSEQTRRKLSVHLLSQQLHEEPPAPRPATIVLSEVDKGSNTHMALFKSGLECAPAATPVISAAFGEHAPAFDFYRTSAGSSSDASLAGPGRNHTSFVHGAGTGPGPDTESGGAP
ncbi:LuxS/MPP-like metallohydrolase [Cubamyces lactineus]|nr:LuxS/MPP-like metallohydrolase [Cubamyces lactineus]